MTQLEYLRDVLGFDKTALADQPYLSIGCSQCQAVAVNGIPLHEAGCPHDTHECKGCNERIPVRQKYCEDCV